MEKYGEEAEEEGFAPKEFQRSEGEVVKFSFSTFNSLLTVKSEVLEDIKPDINKIKAEPIDIDEVNCSSVPRISIKEEYKTLNVLKEEASKKKLKSLPKPSTSTRMF